MVCFAPLFSVSVLVGFTHSTVAFSNELLKLSSISFVLCPPLHELNPLFSFVRTCRLTTFCFRLLFCPLQPNKSGWIEKKGDVGLVKSFKKRYFVLRDGKAYYHKDNKDPNSDGQGSIPLVQAQTIAEATPSNVSNKKNLGREFHIVFPWRRYILLASSRQEMLQWCKVRRVSFSRKDILLIRVDEVVSPSSGSDVIMVITTTFVR